MSRSKKDIQEIADLRRAINVVIERMDLCRFDCCGDTDCAKDPEYHDLPSKWCDACIAKEAREKLRDVLFLKGKSLAEQVVDDIAAVEDEKALGDTPLRTYCRTGCGHRHDTIKEAFECPETGCLRACIWACGNDTFDSLTPIETIVLSKLDQPEWWDKHQPGWRETEKD